MLAAIVAAASGAYWVGVLIGALLMGFICSWLFRRGGRSSVVGFVLGFFLGLIGLIIALIVSFAFPNRERQAAQGNQSAQGYAGAAAPSAPGSFCPSCGQPVAPGTKFCGHCGAQIS